MQLAVLYWGGFDLFLRPVLHQGPVSSTHWFGDDRLQACDVWGVTPTDLLSAFARSRCKQRVFFRSSTSCVVLAFTGATFPCCLWKEEDDQSALQYNFIFFASYCVKLSFACTANCFPSYESDMSTPFGVSLSKKFLCLKINVVHSLVHPSFNPTSSYAPSLAAHSPTSPIVGCPPPPRRIHVPPLPRSWVTLGIR
jgi:hypothetical protein